MSGDQQSKKRKDKKKKKAMLEALQQEEYKEERAHVRLMDDDEEDFVVHQADPDDTAALLQDELEESGSGLCSKIIFLILLATLGLAVGVIFFQLGGVHGPLTDHVDIETLVDAPESHSEVPFDAMEDEEVTDDHFDTPTVTSDHDEDDQVADEPLLTPETESIPDEEVVEPVVETIQVEEQEVSPPEETPELEPEVSADTSLPEEVPEPVAEEQQQEVAEEIEPQPEALETDEEPLAVEGTTYAGVEKEADSFEPQLENDSPELPQESFTMRAEREAVQEAVDQVWVLTVRCVEELRALQTLAKASLTSTAIDAITKRLEPLRTQLDELVQTTSKSLFDGALEQAAHLERNLRAVLDDLEEARTKDMTLAEEEALQEEAARAAEEASQAAEEIAEEVVEEVVEAEPEAEIIAEVESEPEPEVALPSEEAIPAAELESEPPVQQETVPVPLEEPASIMPEQEEVVPPQEPVSQVPEPAQEPSPIELNEVEEPVQVATEAFTVGKTDDGVPQDKPMMEEPSSPPPPPPLDLEEADRLVDQSPAEALTLMEQILEREPGNPLALYGRARALDSLAEIERSNARLEQSIFAYRAVLDLEERVDDILFRRSALRCVDRMRFRGFHNKATRIQQRLISRFPDEIDLQNQLAIGFLLANQPESARPILEQVLERWPNSGFAQVHLGFILKTTFNDIVNGVKFMSSGIASREEGVIDGRFYFHLGDGLTRLGRLQEAQQVYMEGERENLFLSWQQRSLYNVDRLTARPWWSKEDTTYSAFFDLLEANWRDIRDEGVSLLTLEAPQGFADETENLRDSGDWKQYELFSRGKKNVQHCNQAPKTCALIEDFPPALCKRGQVKFSIMHPGTHVWPHTGPTNCRIRSHLGLVVPGGTSLRVSNTTGTWEEGKVIIFDDSFEHEVWHTGSSYRLVLIVDLWHPELTLEERKSLTAI